MDGGSEGGDRPGSARNARSKGRIPPPPSSAAGPSALTHPNMETVVVVRETARSLGLETDTLTSAAQENWRVKVCGRCFCRSTGCGAFVPRRNRALRHCSRQRSKVHSLARAGRNSIHRLGAHGSQRSMNDIKAGMCCDMSMLGLRYAGHTTNSPSTAPRSKPSLSSIRS